MRLSPRAWAPVLLAAVLAACGGEQSADPQLAGQAPPPPLVTVSTVLPQDITLNLEYPGRTAGSREVEVRARIEGILLRRHYEEGERVEAGELLFEIDPLPYEVALQQAEAVLQQAEARLRAASRDQTRAATLFERGVVSEQDRDDRQSAVELAEADLAAAQAAVNAARINLDYTQVTAPISGVTSREAVSEGSLVGPQQEQSLLTTIASLDPLYVWFSYPEADLARLRTQAETREGPLGAELLLNGDTDLYAQPGEVDFTDSIIDPATGTVQARAVFPNPEGLLLPGQFVRVRLNGLTLANALLVPQAAVLQGPQGAFVYRVDENQVAQFTPVVTGQALGDRWVVESGLSAGDRIVSNGLLRVQPGAPVTPEEPGMAPLAPDAGATPGGTGAAAARTGEQAEAP